MKHKVIFLLVTLFSLISCSKRVVPVDNTKKYEIEYANSFESQIIFEENLSIDEPDSSFIQGHIIDPSDLTPIPGCIVIVINNKSGKRFGMISDINGNFLHKIEPGIYTIEIDLIGYKKLHLQTLTFKPSIVKKVVVNLAIDHSVLIL